MIAALVACAALAGGPQAIDLGLGGAVGASWGWSSRSGEMYVLPAASPIGTMHWEYGAEGARLALGFSSAPTFLHVLNGADLPAAPLLMVSVAPLLGSDRFRAGPYGEFGFLDAGCGLMMIARAGTTRRGAPSGVGVRLGYVPLWGGQVAVLYTFDAARGSRSAP